MTLGFDYDGKGKKYVGDESERERRVKWKNKSDKGLFRGVVS